jgi:uncharacterized RDD family membrane protein YckC
MEYQNYQAPASESTDLFAEEPVVYGDFWDRFLAALLDGVILTICNIPIILIFPEGSGNVISLILGWLYYTLQESGSLQATVGKKAMGLKVVDMNGQRISFGRATGRYFGKIISAIILFIGYLMMIWDDKKQTLHDKMANTLIVKR